MSQSPIFLQSVKKTGAVDALPLLDPKALFEINYPAKTSFAGKFEIEEGHANFVLAGPGPLVKFRGADYELRKIHMHSESEHIVETDDPDDFELHLIHAPKESSVAAPLVVVGILFDICSASKQPARQRTVFQQLVKAKKSKTKTTSICPRDFFPLLPGGKDEDVINWFHYEGSLTTYPYAEIVSWFVMKSPGDVTQAEVKEIVCKAMQPHARELQPLDRRLVVRSFK